MEGEDHRLQPERGEACPKLTKIKMDKNTTKYRKGGCAGSKGVEYQICLLAMVILNAMKNTMSKWKLSTENEAAGKFDDIVLEWAEGAVLIQSKHKENSKKRITLEELTSTNSKSDDFSLPKYFLSYMLIKEEFNINNLIICTNAGIHENALEFLNQLTTNTESLLHHESGECSFYTLKDTVITVLKEKTILYYDQNFKNKGIQKTVITEENLSDFLKRLQLFFNYQSLTDLEKIIENLLSLTECCSNSEGGITQKELCSKVMDWFQQKEGVYFKEIHAKSMFAEIWTNKYCEKLKRYKVSLQKNDLNFHGIKQIFHITSFHGNLLQAIQVYYAVQNKKILFVNPDYDIDTQKLILEAFVLPQYAFLVINQLKVMGESVTIEMCAKLRDILGEKTYKKVILIARDNDAFSRYLLHEIDYETINKPVTFTDFSYSLEEKLLKKRCVIFQGKSICLEELLASRITEDYANAVDQEILENIIAGEVNVGIQPLDMDENIAPFYINRTFKRSMKNIHENDIYDVKEKVVLISDNAGVGKTTVLSKLATNIKERNPHLWVIKIALTEYTQLLSDIKDSGESISIMKLLNSKNATKLTNHLERFVFAIEEKVVLMLDGVDEISPDYTELVHNLLAQCLEATNFAKLFVTTRPHMMRELKQIFKVDPFELQPFEEQNQVHFLISYWTHKLNIPHENKEKCEKYARVLIERMSSWTEGGYYGQQKFTAIALQLRMVAEIFAETITLNKFSYWEGCKEYSESVSDSPSLPREIKLKELYDLFIERKRHIYIRKGNPSRNSEANTALNTKFNDSLAYHKKLALEVILRKKNRRLISYYQKSSEVINESVLKIGIVQGSNKRFYFIHRTFAEYFVAESIISELQLQSENPNFEFQKFFINDVLTESNYEIIRAFIECFLQNVVDSIPANIFKSYQSKSANNFYTDEDCIVNVLFGEGHVAILQLIFKCIDFKISDKDLRQQKNKNVFQTIKKKYTAKNRLYALKMLLQDKGLEFRDSHGNTPLAAAARGGHLKMVRFLIDLGAKVNIANEDGSTVLYLAINGGHMDIVKYLVQHDAEINCRSKKGYTPLHIAAVRSDLRCVNYFIESGADITIRDNRDRTLIHFAAMGRQFYPIDFLHKLDEEYFYRFNNSSMHLSVTKEQQTIIELPVKHGEDINVKDEDGCTPLHFAAKYSHVNTVILLHKLGGNLNIRNNFGRTPLHSAVAAEHLDVIEYLSKVGVDLNIKDSQGWTALHSAVSDGRQLDVIKYLSEAGADLNITDDRGWTALHSAAAAGYLDVVKYLVEVGADLNITDNCGGKALHLAAKFGHYNTVKYLIKFNKDVDIKDNDGYTPLLLATSKGHIDVVQFLQQHNASVDIVLHKAVENGCTNEYFLKCVADVNARDNNGSTALHLAAKKGRIDVANSLCKIGADLNITDNCGKTALHLAAEKGHIGTVNSICKKGADLNVTDSHGKTALHLAAEKIQWRTIEALHNLGADLDIRDGSGRTALHSTATCEFSSIVKSLLECRADLNRDNYSWMKMHSAVVLELWSTLTYLVQAGADLNITDDRGKTVLHSAAASGNLILVKYLHKSGADLNVKDINSVTALHSAALSKHLDVVKYLLEARAALHITDDGDHGYLDVVDNLLKAEADLNITDDHGLTPQSLTVASEHWDLVEYLYKGGADLNATDINGETVLHSAASYGHLDVVKSLLEADADLNITDKRGRTALHLATTAGHLDVVKALLEANADLNIADKRGRTALHLATTAGHLYVVKVLLEAEADLNITENQGWTALHSAATAGSLNIAKDLLEAGADLNITDKRGRRALHLATTAGHLDVVKALLEAGADLNITDDYNRTALHWAASNGHLDVVKSLIEAGADLNITDSHGWTPLHIAATYRQLDVVKYLRRVGADFTIKDEDGRTPMQLANFKCRLQNCRVL